jgi:hypothetical protein
MGNVISFKNRLTPKKQTKIDLTLDGLTNDQASSIFNIKLDQSVKLRKGAFKGNSMEGSLYERVKFD